MGTVAPSPGRPAPRVDPTATKPAALEQPPAVAAPAPASTSTTREAVKLLWFDPECLPRFRNHSRWGAILADFELRRNARGGDDSARSVLEVLARGEPAGFAEIDRAFVEAMDGGRFEPPLVLVSGELELPFDELELLKATVTMASPLAPGDKKLNETLESVNEALKIPGLHSASGIAEGLTRRVEEALGPARDRQRLPADYLEAGRTRMLLAQRHYQRRTLWGVTWLRGLLRPAGGGAVVAYVPEGLATRLPLVQVMPVKVVAEVDSWQEPGDNGIAVRVGVLGLSVTR